MASPGRRDNLPRPSDPAGPVRKRQSGPALLVSLSASSCGGGRADSGKRTADTKVDRRAELKQAVHKPGYVPLRLDHLLA